MEHLGNLGKRLFMCIFVDERKNVIFYFFVGEKYHIVPFDIEFLICYVCFLFFRAKVETGRNFERKRNSN